ncbi:MAG TPA: 16S rRNA (guanine(966)-N(2))-methyltransferase RsmD [Gammaproteobacteria bacterium]|nr:16S rRNA (guanine(966)-N(2))-methyltransferase RsmD [Gammaproteobacteria bacterium]
MLRGKSNRLRIIGGEWRGRIVEFIDSPQLRPTKDLVRETLFNWLQPRLPGSICLDAFAGSGALGFEAASRGAAEVVMLDAAAAVVRQLQSQQAALKAVQVKLLQERAENYLRQSADTFDIVFLDPPFESDLSAHCCALLVEQRLLRPGASVYLEARRAEGLPELPPQLTWLRQKQSGDVAYGLAQYEGSL